MVALGAHLGGSAKELEKVRETLGPILASNQNIKVSRSVTSNHTRMLKRDFLAVADAIREIPSE